MQTLKRGILISIEGIDGSGKSTLSRGLHQKFLDDDITVHLTYEPGATQLGKQLRTILHDRDFPVCPKAEYLMFASDRAQHFDEVIVPLLKQNTLIISDRMADSSLVYQGYARGLDLQMLRTINDWAMNGRHPDVTMYVTAPIAIALERIHQRAQLTSFEKEKESFFEKVANGFEDLFRDRDNIITVDGTLEKDKLITTAYTAIVTWIKQNNLLP